MRTRREVLLEATTAGGVRACGPYGVGAARLAVVIAAVLVATTLPTAGAPPAGARQQIPGKGLYDLVRHLRAQGRGDERSSAPIRLRDRDSGLAATFQLVTAERGEPYATFSFGRRGEALFIHTVRISDGERVARPGIVDLQPVREDDGLGELVVARLDAAALDWMADATTLEVVLEGWETRLATPVTAKGIGRIRAFREARVAAGLQDGEPP